MYTSQWSTPTRLARGVAPLGHVSRAAWDGVPGPSGWGHTSGRGGGGRGAALAFGSQTPHETRAGKRSERGGTGFQAGRVVPGGLPATYRASGTRQPLEWPHGGVSELRTSDLEGDSTVPFVRKGAGTDPGRAVVDVSHRHAYLTARAE